MEKYLLEECPICRGAGLIMHEGGWSVQVECADCSAHTIYMEYNSESEKGLYTISGSGSKRGIAGKVQEK